ncbi:MAG: alpha/beta hydrolase-fold protein [Oscillospiraceae bacterium]|nr:alpha/beta hydrolase-fold protein [Oscillospiraceae bacterium]MCL2278160.1 alpha/beta hydrolase-fold protein [Oscillospiraceae bacterium]
MALLTLDFYSRELKMSTLLTMVTPDSTHIGEMPVSERKCLYLLHGLSDDATSFLRLSRVELFSRDAGVTVIMPSVGRSMYCDDVNGQNYFSFVANELPEYLNLLIGVPRKRELNNIAGISMGGYGAARIALTYPERYKKVGLFSGFLSPVAILPRLTEEQRNEFPFMMVKKDELETTSLEPMNLLDAEKHKDLEFTVRCGEQDDLYLMSVGFCKKAKHLGLNVESVFEPGSHEWRLWDKYIEDFILAMK